MKKFLLVAATALLTSHSVHAATTINAANHFAYGANIGWMDWRGNVANGAVIGEYVCSGAIWAANVGWILLGNGAPVNGISYQNNAANDYGVNHDGSGNLTGLAWGPNIGWVSFHPTGNPRLDLKTGKLIGFAWAANAGWISLSNVAAHVQTDSIRPGADTDGDGIADAWERLRFGNLLAANSTTDADGDGFSDRREYDADSDPLNPSSYLRITGFDSDAGGSPVLVRWTSRPTRCYFIEETANLNSPILWADSGLGLISPDAGATTTRNFVDTFSPQRFFRVRVVKPLSP